MRCWAPTRRPARDRRDGMKALITGGAGFIGSTLADRLLAEDWSVDVADDLSSGNLANLADARAVGDRRFSFHRIDIRNAAVTDLIATRKPDVVFHLAAQADVRVSVARPQFDAEVNLVGLLNVCEGARAGGASKVVFASSGGTIYGTPDGDPDAGDAPAAARSRRTASRRRPAATTSTTTATIHGLDYVATAFSNVYGPRQDPHGEAGVVAIFAGLFLERKRPTIFGDGDQTRDFVFVDDVVDALTRGRDPGRGDRQHRHRGRDERQRPLRLDGPRHRRATSRRATRRRGPVSSPAPRSRSAGPRSSSAGSRSRRSTTASPRRSTGSAPAGRRLPSVGMPHEQIDGVPIWFEEHGDRRRSAAGRLARRHPHVRAQLRRRAPVVVPWAPRHRRRARGPRPHAGHRSGDLDRPLR